MYAYMLSMGTYSDYEVQYIAIHEMKIPETEMEKYIEEIKKKYLKVSYDKDLDKDYLDEDVVIGIIIEILKTKGFKVVFSVGEFHVDKHEGIEGITVAIPWRATSDKNPMMENFA